MQDLRKTVLITGGARRVGAALAQTLATRGWNIALHYNSTADGAKEVQKAVIKTGAVCELFCYDLSEAASWEALPAEVFDRFPQCRALVNNASVFEKRRFLDTRPEDFDRQMTINFKAPFFLTQAFVRHQPEARIVNMLDTAVSGNEVPNFPYLLSKKGLMHFTQMAAVALGPEARVNAVCPGIVLPLGEDDEAYMKRLGTQLPMQRVARLEEVVDAVHFLLEHDSLTGQMMFIDGGEHLLTKRTV